jgi:argininosuccinate lyase
MTPLVVKGIRKVLADGELPGAKRPTLVITFEPLLIQAAGPQITLLHAGRSSQDMLHAARGDPARRPADAGQPAQRHHGRTGQAGRQPARHHRAQLHQWRGRPAQQLRPLPAGLAAALDRDAQRLREAYARLDRSAMGTTVLNGTSWPLNRQRMADYLGFPPSSTTPMTRADRRPSMAGGSGRCGLLHRPACRRLHPGRDDAICAAASVDPAAGGRRQYLCLFGHAAEAQSGLLNSTRRDASTVIAEGMGVAIVAHNLPPA